MAILRDHSCRDLKSFGDVTVADAVLQGLVMVKNMKSRNNRGVVWFGESHAYVCDVARRQAMIDHFFPDEGLILVVERSLSSGAKLGSEMVEALFEYRRGGVTEAADRMTYNIRERNVRISAAIARECQNDSPNKMRPVVILFGDEHSEPIKQMLAANLPANEILEWWDAPPISDTLLARVNTTMPPQATHWLICGAEAQEGSEVDVQLLQRSCGLSLLGDSTFTALSPLHYNQAAFRHDQWTYALFGRNNDPQMQALNDRFNNPQGAQARTFRYLNHRVASLNPYVVVSVKSPELFASVNERWLQESS